MNTKTIGDRAEGMVLAALLRQGKTVLMPLGDNERYDLVIDEDGEFTRIQCKNGRLRSGAVRFNTCSIHPRTYKRRDYRGQADVFGVYCEELDSVYLVPVDDVGRAEGILRVDPPRNGQKRGVCMAADYEIRR